MKWLGPNIWLKSHPASQGRSWERNKNCSIKITWVLPPWGGREDYESNTTHRSS
jgi:hypothetical protein